MYESLVHTQSALIPAGWIEQALKVAPAHHQQRLSDLERQGLVKVTKFSRAEAESQEDLGWGDAPIPEAWERWDFYTPPAFCGLTNDAMEVMVAMPYQGDRSVEELARATHLDEIRVLAVLRGNPWYAPSRGRWFFGYYYRLYSAALALADGATPEDYLSDYVA